MHFSEILIELKSSRSSLLIESKEDCIEIARFWTVEPLRNGFRWIVAPREFIADI
jgi:hypothetical protein